MPPPPGQSIRVPMLIVSPYARPSYTDPTPATFASVLTFTESVFALQPLAVKDSGAYNFMQSFNFAQAPLTPVPMSTTPVPAGSFRAVANSPPDPNDPT
jgi:phospholipase C